MEILPTPLAGVFVIETPTFVDYRGTFTRYYCERDLAEVIGTRRIVQINHSHTRVVGGVRGLHFQRSPHAEMKLIRCIKGSVWDVAVDLRADSPTFLHWHAETLSPDNARMLVIPEGCAHGFQALEAASEIMYFVTSCYAPESERAVRYDDERVAIAWPLAVTGLSARDRDTPSLAPDFLGVCL